MPPRSVSRVGGRRSNTSLRIKLAGAPPELTTYGSAPDSSNNFPAFFWEQPSGGEERAPLVPRQVVQLQPLQPGRAQQVGNGGGYCGLPPPPQLPPPWQQHQEQLSITVSCPAQQQRPPWQREEAVAPQLPPGVLPWARQVAAPPLVPPGFLPTAVAAPPLLPPGFLPTAAPVALHGSRWQEQQEQRPPQAAGNRQPERRNPAVLKQKPVLVLARPPPNAPAQQKPVPALPPLPIQPGQRQRVAQAAAPAAAGGHLLWFCALMLLLCFGLMLVHTVVLFSHACLADHSPLAVCFPQHPQRPKRRLRHHLRVRHPWRRPQRSAHPCRLQARPLQQ